MIYKHAYLIIAHKSDETFDTLIRLLDDPMNDIFVHMDKKNKAFSENTIHTQYSRLIFIERTNVTWGGYSQINAELLLLKCAVKGKYKYYHLLSGEDLPIKTQKEIHRFFDSNDSKIFVDFQSKEIDCFERVKYYHLFQEFLGRKYYVLPNLIFIKMQKILHVNRNKDIIFAKGANWFSIPHDFAQYIIDNEKTIKKVFKYTINGDELFLQTLLINSSYIDRLYYKKFDDNPVSIMREIDWKRGKPYIYRIDDLSMLIQSDRMFARKFDCKVDDLIIKAIKDHLQRM